MAVRGMPKSVFDIFAGKNLANMGTLSMLGTGINVYMGVDTYKTAREQGSSQIGAASKAVSDMVMMDVMGMGKYIGLQAVTALPKAGIRAYETMNQAARSMSSLSKNAPFYAAKFQDSQQAYTMRQAGMQLAQASKYNLQQTMLGNEASYMHY